MAGTFWALLTVVIWSAWPACTRLSIVGQTLSLQDLVALRYAVGGLVLLPFLIRLAPTLSAQAWRTGALLAFFQGAPLAMLVTLGVRFAPAGHMGALSPGLLPLYAAVIGYVVLGEPVSPVRRGGLLLIAGGALLLTGFSVFVFSGDIWRGDLMFMCAGLMGSIYSMLIYVPLCAVLWLSSGGLLTASPRELVFQAFYQGLLMGAVTLFTLSRAIVILGAVQATAFISLVPVMGTIAGALVLGERPSAYEWLAVAAISLGVLLATGVVDKRLTAPPRASS